MGIGIKRLSGGIHTPNERLSLSICTKAVEYLEPFDLTSYPAWNNLFLILTYPAILKFLLVKKNQRDLGITYIHNLMSHVKIIGLSVSIQSCGCIIVQEVVIDRYVTIILD